jgi:hypothetical protein
MKVLSLVMLCHVWLTLANAWEEPNASSSEILLNIYLQPSTLAQAVTRLP